MKQLSVVLVAMNLADVATLAGKLPRFNLTAAKRLDRAIDLLVADTQILNYARPKLVGAYDETGGVSLLYRVRTMSRGLSPSMHWRPVNHPDLDFEDLKWLNEALRYERP